ncbi:Phosphoribosyl transferase domain protein [Madurella fahalii]|uniref:Phosphoribosyl transferase domain protein n=1 Tax=Madurella fahalii TaxID=1157608 RepID=A0ABQ0GCR8_9PEZI
MATLDSLKLALRRKVGATAPPTNHPLSDEEYSAGFDILTQGLGWTSYEDFVIPHLSRLLAPLFDSRVRVSVLEIGPGPKTVLGYLPDRMRRKIRKYTALEPNGLFATRLEKWLCPTSQGAPPLPCLESQPDIHRIPFVADSEDAATGAGGDGGKFDVVLFCHSMYGMKPKHSFIRRALDMLRDQPQGALVVVFHRERLYLDGLVCQQTASFPAGVVSVADDGEVLDRFAAFVAGFAAQDAATRAEWRDVCCALGRRCREAAAHQAHLLFGAPTVMAAFTQHATALPELAAEVPLLNGDGDGDGDGTVKNREARLRRPAAIARPIEVGHVRACVRWALRHGVGLSVIGGGHSGHCLWPNVVGVDMRAFDQAHIIPAREDSDSGPLIVAGAGCKTGDIIRKAMAAGLTVPLGARPSVGAGLWLQGGIGHLARLHGLACDAIVGAVVVSVASAEVVTVGCVPSQHRPAGAVHLSETDLLWAIKGAGTNFGIVISVTFKAYGTQTYSVRNWVVTLSDQREARRQLSDFDRLVAGQLPRVCSADAYLYWDSGSLRLGVTMFETSTAGTNCKTPPPAHANVAAILGPQTSFRIVDSVGVFDAEMYMSGMHGGHGGGKTSSFKRCLFLKHIGEANIADILMAAVETRPTPLCYLHLLHGGGAVGDVAADSTAFGCRDWDFACVVTGVWPREQDGVEDARAAVDWVYKVAKELLPVSCGAYGADLGPDSRDAALAARAFGPNLPRLAHLKRGCWDPRNVLSYACPLPRTAMEPKLIVLVTGESGAGKDYCADVWVSVFTNRGFEARAVSISEATKHEYAAATGADVNRLLRDRTYKEQHRSALAAFFQNQVQQRPRLPEEHFLEVVYGAVDVDVLFITGMRDEAPVASLSRLVPESRLLEVYVQASDGTRRARRTRNCNGEPDPTPLNYRPSFVFDNDATGDEAARGFSEHHLLPFLHEDLQRLAAMVRSVPDFPRPGIEFRHVLGISQQPGGLALCAALLERHFSGRWAAVDVVACCEAGGFVYASALAARVDVPLALIREAGKLPPPTVSVVKSPSHISSSKSNHDSKARIEMDRDAVPKGASVLVVDDVLATGRTLCAVLRLLGEAGVGPENVSVMVVAEFPVHRGRELLRRHGFGGVSAQSLLVFGGA